MYSFAIWCIKLSNSFVCVFLAVGVFEADPLYAHSQQCVVVCNDVQVCAIQWVALCMCFFGSRCNWGSSFICPLSTMCCRLQWRAGVCYPMGGCVYVFLWQSVLLRQLFYMATLNNVLSFAMTCRCVLSDRWLSNSEWQWRWCSCVQVARTRMCVPSLACKHPCTPAKQTCCTFQEVIGMFMYRVIAI